MEKISSFNFEVMYVPGSENVVVEALSHLYSNDSVGMVHAPSEYVYHDVSDNDTSDLMTSMPLLAGMEAVIATQRGERIHKLSAKVVEAGCPEISAEFASCMANRFVLYGP